VNAFYLVLAASPVLLLVLTIFFTMIVVGIRKGDRGDLAAPPRNRIDAITRKVAGMGTRRDSTDSEQV
jgi:hypothetical protein